MKKTTQAQIIAIEKGTKTRAERELTDAHHAFQKPEPLSGIARSYSPFKDEDGERVPPESKRVQIKAEDIVAKLATTLTDLFDIVATKDSTNCVAKADVVVNGKVLLSDVPCTYLLFLEKQLVNLRTFVEKLPTLDPADAWQWDDGQACYSTPPQQTLRTKKEPRVITKAEPTDKHPAQVELIYEDRPVGTWTTIRYSGALPQTRVDELTTRVEQLQRAVKFAREAANSIEAVNRTGDGRKVMDYLFAR